MFKNSIRYISKMAKNFYAVRVGRNPGIYHSWSECEEQVKNFPSARFKKFATQEEALKFIAPDENTKIKTGKLLEENFKLKSTIVTTSFNKRKCIDDQHNAKKLKLNNSIPHTFEKSKSIEIKINEKILDALNELDKNETKHIYTDGACSSNGNQAACAGIGVYWGPNHPLNTSKRLSGRQTNNRAEIHAAAYALMQAKAHGFKNVTIHTDSKFLIASITKWIKKWKENGWKLSTGKDVINKEDFLVLEEAMEEMDVSWVHVRGHQGDPGNEAADRLAVAGITAEEFY